MDSSHIKEYGKIEHFKEDVQHEKLIKECFKVIVGHKDGKVVSRHSHSVDRMINETAQFFEAVGEKPPSNFGKILQEIIEDESNSTDDDDNNNIDDRTSENKSSKIVNNNLEMFSTLFLNALIRQEHLNTEDGLIIDV